jgi:glycosyltransferase involved in cell wall biosynthesis
MKLLFLTPQLPYPAISGGVIKSFKLVEFLSHNHQLSLACLLKSDADESNLPALKALLPINEVFSESLNIPRNPVNFIKSCLAAIPLTIYRNRSRSLAKTISDIGSDYEVIFVDHYLMFQYIPKNFSGKVVLHQHNAEFLLWSRMAGQMNNGVKALMKKVLLKFEAGRIRRYEVTMCQHADVVLAAPNDQQALIEAGSTAANFVDTYHLGDEVNLDLPALDFNQTRPAVLFIGTLSWEANVDGLIWFLTDIWPRIKAANPQVTFTIAGKCSSQLKSKLVTLAPEVDLPGFVDDLDVLYQQHRVFVAPLRFGSGIKVKVVNSLYRGIPSVTTSVGAEGMALVSGEHLYIEDDADSFAQSVLNLLQDESDWQRLSVQSRQHMRAHYRWNVVFDNVQRSLKGVTDEQ